MKLFHCRRAYQPLELVNFLFGIFLSHFRQRNTGADLSRKSLFPHHDQLNA